MSGRHKPLEDFGEIFGDLFESELEGFVLSIFQSAHQFLDFVVASIEFFFAFEKFGLLFRERYELVQGFLIDMTENQWVS